MSDKSAVSNRSTPVKVFFLLKHFKPVILKDFPVKNDESKLIDILNLKIQSLKFKGFKGFNWFVARWKPLSDATALQSVQSVSNEKSPKWHCSVHHTELCNPKKEL